MQQVVPTIVVDAPSLFPNSLTMSFSSKSPEDNIPPNCGQRLLPTTIDEIAECDPHRIFASILRSPTNIEEGYRDVSFHEAAAAINTLAWLLDAELGKSHTFETLAYLAPGDLRYALIAVAAVKVGYKVCCYPLIIYVCISTDIGRCSFLRLEIAWPHRLIF